jgi:hypothetical protein
MQPPNAAGIPPLQPRRMMPNQQVAQPPASRKRSMENRSPDRQTARSAESRADGKNQCSPCRTYKLYSCCPRKNQHYVSATLPSLSGASATISTVWDRLRKAATARQRFPQSNQRCNQGPPVANHSRSSVVTTCSSDGSGVIICTVTSIPGFHESIAFQAGGHGFRLPGASRTLYDRA